VAKINVSTGSSFFIFKYIILIHQDSINLFTLSQHFIVIYLSVASLNNSYNFFENINIKIVARKI